MKKKVLLVDESLTVQKVVSLTLDKMRYHVSFAKSKNDLIKQIVESTPDLILISDQIPEINVASFPKELKSWVGGVRDVAPVVLITGQDIREQRHYAAVLKKPFTPQALQAVVTEFTREESSPSESRGDAGEAGDDDEDQRLQKIFNDTFADEATLVRETYQADAETGDNAMPSQVERPSRNRPEPGPNLWSQSSRKETPPMNTSSPSTHSQQASWSKEKSSEVGMVSEALLEKEFKSMGLDEAVDRVLTRLVPPIVERLVQERLDKLLKDQEQFIDIKP